MTSEASRPGRVSLPDEARTPKATALNQRIGYTLAAVVIVPVVVWLVNVRLLGVQLVAWHGYNAEAAALPNRGGSVEVTPTRSRSRAR